MLECSQCGKVIPHRREKGHREREYCSDLCRKRAWRTRNKSKHRIDRIVQDAQERMWNKIDQDIHRETWQDDIEKLEKERGVMRQENNYLWRCKEQLEQQLQFTQDLLADKEAEIVRLTVLLEGQAKRKR